MDINTKIKFINFIERNKLFFTIKKTKNNYNVSTVRKVDSLSSLSQFTLHMIIFDPNNNINSSDFELTVLPIFKPRMRLNFTRNANGENIELHSNFNVFLLKGLIFFCINMLPIFKRKEVLQGEILRIQIILCNTCFADKLFLEESFKEKTPRLIRSFGWNPKEKWSRKTRQIFSSNGFIEFRKSHFYPFYDFSLKGYLKNDSLIRFNTGPEYRFNLRY